MIKQKKYFKSSSNLGGSRRSRVVRKSKANRAQQLKSLRSDSGYSQPLMGKSTLTEVKCVDNSFTGTALVAYNLMVLHNTSMTTGWVMLNGIQLGTANYQRIGKKVVINQMVISFTLEGFDTTPDFTDNQVVRVMVVYDSQPNKTAPAYTDIIYGLDQGGSNVTGIETGINIVNSKRFRILRNKYYVLDYTNKWLYNIKYVIKGNFETEYASTNSPVTIADVTHGAIYLMVCAYKPGTGDYGSIKNVRCRLRYID